MLSQPQTQIALRCSDVPSDRGRVERVMVLPDEAFQVLRRCMNFSSAGVSGHYSVARIQTKRQICFHVPQWC